MKQTVGILTALMIALLLVSGFIVMGSMQQSRTLLDKEQTIRALQTERDHLKTENAMQKREMERNAQLLAQTMEERDALSQQWNDAVLSSQETNDALASREEAYKEQVLRVQQLENRVTELLAQLESMPAPKPTRIERTVTR